MSNYAKIKNFDIVNGRGIGVSIFLSGCGMNPKCKGCFNSEAWDFNSGQPFTNDTLKELMDMCGNEHIDHLSILGGEPLDKRNVATTYKICKTFKELYPNKKLWLWTGYKLRYDDFIRHKQGKLTRYQVSVVDRIVELCEVIIDQPFVLEQRDLTLKWRGSKNQRVVDVKQTLEQGEVVFYG